MLMLIPFVGSGLTPDCQIEVSMNSGAGQSGHG